MPTSKRKVKSKKRTKAGSKNDGSTGNATYLRLKKEIDAIALKIRSQGNTDALEDELDQLEDVIGEVCDLETREKLNELLDEIK